MEPKTVTTATTEAAGIAAISIVISLLKHLMEEGVLSDNLTQKVLMQAYLDQSDVGEIPKTQMNDRAQKLIAEIMAALKD